MQLVDENQASLLNEKACTWFLVPNNFAFMLTCFLLCRCMLLLLHECLGDITSSRRFCRKRHRVWGLLQQQVYYYVLENIFKCRFLVMQRCCKIRHPVYLRCHSITSEWNSLDSLFLSTSPNPAGRTLMAPGKSFPRSFTGCKIIRKNISILCTNCF